MAPVLVPLRPSSEHILIVRAPGARDQHGCHSSPFIMRVLRAWKSTTSAPTLFAFSKDFHTLLPIHFCSEGRYGILIYASNEGLLRPRVARALGWPILLHPLLI